MIAGPDYGVAVPDRRPRAATWARCTAGTKLAALADAAAFCLPSRHEGFSLAVLEALGGRRARS